MIAPHVLSSFNSQGLMRHLGVTMRSASEGRCILEVGFAPTHTQQRGYFHAGVTSSIADTAAGYAAISLISEEEDVLTIEFKINLMNPAVGDQLRAEAEVIKRGRTIMVTRGRVRRAWRGESAMLRVSRDDVRRSATCYRLIPVGDVIWAPNSRRRQAKRPSSPCGPSPEYALLDRALHLLACLDQTGDIPPTGIGCDRRCIQESDQPHRWRQPGAHLGCDPQREQG